MPHPLFHPVNPVKIQFFNCIVPAKSGYEEIKNYAFVPKTAHFARQTRAKRISLALNSRSKSQSISPYCTLLHPIAL
jgi:hypothetical protein